MNYNGIPPVAGGITSEDSVADGGESIDTFAHYRPSALPDALIAVLNDKAGREVVDDCDDDSSVIIIDVDEIQAKKESSIFLPDSVPSHPSLACESALLSSVRAPKVSDDAAITLIDLAKSQLLSPLQLEGVCLAISRHNRLFRKVSSTNVQFPSSSSEVVRAGFFLGDGAGVGKGRQIAAILRDSLCRTRNTQRHLWISVSRELVVDAQRDLNDVGVHCRLHDGSELLDQYAATSAAGLGAALGLQKGILFLTYALLVSGRRMEEIIQWLASGMSTSSSASRKNECWEMEQKFDGCIIFDEAHKAKNLEADTATAKLVIQLQRRLPRARLVYCSATGVSDVKHMVYAERLGLWSSTTDDNMSSGIRSLFESFQHFQATLKQRGLGSLEMLALEMKQMGTFVARTLSWDGAEFETIEVPLIPSQTQVYDAAVQWWTSLKAEMEQALAVLTRFGSPPNKMIWRAFWSAHQRFFKEMAICAKVPFVAENAKIMLAKGNSVIIGLQSTGESGTQQALDELRATFSQDNEAASPTVDIETFELPDLLSTTAAIMIGFVRNHFPTSPLSPKVQNMVGGCNASEDRIVQMQAEIERDKLRPSPAPLPELVEKRQRILEKISALGLPPNPLDDLIDRLGGIEEVAEMTGRSARIIRCKSAKKCFQYVKRGSQSKKNSYAFSAPCSEETDRVNLTEKCKFMDGKKSVAIISDAASTGISLHSAKGCGSSNKRRVHYTIELPWAADKAIQQLGRSHRSNQVTAPIYKLVVTNLGGERRFSAAVSKRMANMGALTKGDRRASTGSDLTDFDLDNRFGNRALKRFYSALSMDPPMKPSRNSNVIMDEFLTLLRDDHPAVVSQSDSSFDNPVILLIAKQSLEEMGLISTIIDSKKGQEVRSFLNRISGLTVLKQNLLFALFSSTFDDVIAEAKSTGEFEGGVEDIKATNIEIKGKPEVLAVDQSSGTLTYLTRLVLDRGISLSSVCGMALASSESMLEASANVDSADCNNNDSKERIAETGFYCSRNPVSGRHLILFAKRKVAVESFNTLADAIDYDPFGLMVITRPNTGTNLCEMTTRELNMKYKIILTSKRLKLLLQSAREESPDSTLPEAILTQKFPELATLWNAAFNDTDHFGYVSNNLAPRRQEIGLITGAVLHVMPALEKAVMSRSSKERALKVLRVEVTNTSQRIVGVRFPVDLDAVTRLKEILVDLKKARRNEGNKHYYDETFAPVCQKTMLWATTERKTMKTFFSVIPSGKTINNCSESSSIVKSDDKPINTVKRLCNATPGDNKASFVSSKKSKNIASFFTKKN